MGLFSRIVRRTKKEVQDAANEIIDGTLEEVEDAVEDLVNRTVIKKIYTLTRKALNKLQKVKDLANMTQEEIVKEVKDRIWDEVDKLVPDAKEIEDYIDKIIIDTLNTIL